MDAVLRVSVRVFVIWEHINLSSWDSTEVIDGQVSYMKIEPQDYALPYQNR